MLIELEYAIGLSRGQIGGTRKISIKPSVVNDAIMQTVLGGDVVKKYTLLVPAKSVFNAFKPTALACRGDVSLVDKLKTTLDVRDRETIFDRVAEAGVAVLSKMNAKGWDHGGIDLTSIKICTLKNEVSAKISGFGKAFEIQTGRPHKGRQQLVSVLDSHLFGIDASSGWRWITIEMLKADEINWIALADVMISKKARSDY